MRKRLRAAHGEDASCIPVVRDEGGCQPRQVLDMDRLLAGLARPKARKYGQFCEQLLQRDATERLGCYVDKKGRARSDARLVRHHALLASTNWLRMEAGEEKPVFVPREGVVNARDVTEIDQLGGGDVKLTEEDKRAFEKFPCVVGLAFQEEVLSTVFDEANAAPMLDPNDPASFEPPKKRSWTDKLFQRGGGGAAGTSAKSAGGKGDGKRTARRSSSYPFAVNADAPAASPAAMVIVESGDGEGGASGLGDGKDPATRHTFGSSPLMHVRSESAAGLNDRMAAEDIGGISGGGPADASRGGEHGGRSTGSSALSLPTETKSKKKRFSSLFKTKTSQ